MTRPTRHEQAEAIVRLRGRRMASRILERRATIGVDFDEAFTLEWIDLVAAVPDPATLLSLGRNVVGPRDGLYVIAEDGTFRVYVQEKGEPRGERRGLDFDEARAEVIGHLVRLNGIPWTP